MKSIIVKCSGVGGQFFISFFFFGTLFQSRQYKFFHYKKSIKVNEFEFLFHCEKKNHLEHWIFFFLLFIMYFTIVNYVNLSFDTLVISIKKKQQQNFVINIF